MLNKSHFHLPRCSKFGPRLLHDLCQELDGNGQHAMPWHIMPCHAHHYLTYYTMPWRAMPWNPCIYIYMGASILYPSRQNSVDYPSNKTR